jgi:hypothetical protein
MRDLALGPRDLLECLVDGVEALGAAVQRFVGDADPRAELLRVRLDVAEEVGDGREEDARHIDGAPGNLFRNLPLHFGERLARWIERAALID